VGFAPGGSIVPQALGRLGANLTTQATVPAYFSLMTQGSFAPVSLLHYVVDGATAGFKNHFSGAPTGLRYTPNYGSATADHEAMSTSLRKRLSAGQTLGPFSWDKSLPQGVPALCVDPLGAVPYKFFTRAMHRIHFFIFHAASAGTPLEAHTINFRVRHNFNYRPPFALLRGRILAPRA
jgi:hypothetical protein